MPTRRLHFSGARQYIAWFKEQRAINGPLGGFSGTPGIDETQVQRGMDFMLKGDEKNLAQARAYMNQITSKTIEVPRTERTYSQAGHYPSISRYLAGHPKNMIRLKRTPTERAPLKVYIGMTSSANIGEDDLIRRGAALAAFAMIMAPTRQVELIPFVCLGSSSFSSRYSRNPDDSRVRGMIISWRISTSPLVLSELMSLTQPEVNRYLGIEACQQLFGKVASRDPGFHHDSWDEEAMRKHLGCKPSDLYLPPLYGRDPILKDPVKWINEKITAYTTGRNTDFKVKPTDTF